MAEIAPPALKFEHVSFAFDEQVILQDVSFELPKGGLNFLLGASGSGKSILLKLGLGLFRPDAGQIFINGQRIDDLPEQDLLHLRADLGMLFQETALFDSLTVGENVGYRLYEETPMPLDQVRTRVEEVLGFVGLRPFVDRMPSELSGGQRRRVAIARAVASRPNLVFFDDPTVGLDPITATTVDDEIVKLRDLEHVSSIVVTHTIRDARYIAMHEAASTNGSVQIANADETKSVHARFMVLHEGRIRFEGNIIELLASEDPYLKEFLFMTLPPW